MTETDLTDGQIVVPAVWLASTRFQHPRYPDGEPVLVGDYVTTPGLEGMYMVLSVHVDQYGKSVEPWVELGEPVNDPSDIDRVYASTQLHTVEVEGSDEGAKSIEPVSFPIVDLTKCDPESNSYE